MDYTSAPGYVTVNGVRQFVDRDVANGVPGTSLIATDKNAVQNELMKVITAAGLTPSPDDLTQLYQALLKIVAQAAASAAVGFTPVEQGGAPNQSTNKVNLGWDTTLGAFRIAIGGSDIGVLVRSNSASLNAATAVGNMYFDEGFFHVAPISGSDLRLVSTADYSSASSYGTDGSMMAYRKSPDGIIRQSGRVITPQVGTPQIYNIQFPVPFPQEVREYGAVQLDADMPSGSVFSVGNYTNQGMTLLNSGGFSMSWWAEGI
ncbi:hypothetical protein AA0472_1128 [Acetobacter estunensis NRIC 0472]|uniref:hypothetical protein n=1 Tax=Acetobacter estunensis TaxID=104097 RepID=UPI001408AF0A|nr:hypothetical protein [Acetobacter estunensis]GBQ23526.1 hypothetical protein AA0472_1128 [Acetobacter estunensis NRIC 0472]